MYTAEEDCLHQRIQRAASRLILEKGAAKTTMAEVASKAGIAEEELREFACSVPEAAVGSSFQGMTALIREYLTTAPQDHFIDYYFELMIKLYRTREQDPSYMQTMRLVREASDKELSVRGAQYQQVREHQSNVADLIVSLKGWDDGDPRAWAVGSLVNATLIGAIESFTYGQVPSISEGIEHTWRAMREALTDADMTNLA